MNCGKRRRKKQNKIERKEEHEGEERQLCKHGKNLKNKRKGELKIPIQLDLSETSRTTTQRAWRRNKVRVVCSHHSGTRMSITRPGTGAGVW